MKIKKSVTTLYPAAVVVAAVVIAARAIAGCGEDGDFFNLFPEVVNHCPSHCQKNVWDEAYACEDSHPWDGCDLTDPEGVTYRAPDPIWKDFTVYQGECTYLGGGVYQCHNFDYDNPSYLTNGKPPWAHVYAC